MYLKGVDLFQVCDFTWLCVLRGFIGKLGRAVRLLCALCVSSLAKASDLEFTCTTWVVSLLRAWGLEAMTPRLDTMSENKYSMHNIQN